MAKHALKSFAAVALCLTHRTLGLRRSYTLHSQLHKWWRLPPKYHFVSAFRLPVLDIDRLRCMYGTRFQRTHVFSYSDTQKNIRRQKSSAIVYLSADSRGLQCLAFSGVTIREAK